TEIWPNFLWTAQSLSIPTILINGRLSDRSVQRYLRFKKWLPHFNESWMQTESDAEKMRSLGTANVYVSGNLKYDVQPARASGELAAILTHWKADSLLWIAGSTMPGEEELILETFKALKQDQLLKLLIAPRHPERFPDVSALIAREGFKFGLRSESNMDAASLKNDILVLDTIGELAGAYELADIVLIGGTLLEDGGGHNPIEPAFFGKPIVSGIHFNNFRHVFQDFQRNNAIFITDHLLTDMRQLLNSPEKRSAIGTAARSLVEQNAGATQKILDGVLRLIERHTVPAQLLN
ncbi:MAG: 3-deoxy-D-manno-octulosonic acid transferase, partial [Acidobacteriota bacterium]